MVGSSRQDAAIRSGNVMFTCLAVDAGGRPDTLRGMAEPHPDGGPSGLLTEQEAAQFLRVSARTLRWWRAEGKGPPFVPVGRRFLYRRVTLERWIAQQERQPGAGK
jgi:excisionase family DNA binding protein